MEKLRVRVRVRVRLRVRVRVRTYMEEGVWRREHGKGIGRSGGGVTTKCIEE